MDYAGEGRTARNPALDQAILFAAARQLGERGHARMSLKPVQAKKAPGAGR